MSSVTLNGAPVVSCRIRMPAVGAWTAELEADTDRAPTGAVEIAAGGQVFRGTVRQGGETGAAAVVRVVGGAGGLARELEPRFYRSPTVRVVLGDILREAGEQLSSTADVDVLERMLPAWSRARQQASAALQEVIQTTGATWRVLANGTVWVGRDTWPTVTVDGELLDEIPSSGRLSLADEALAVVPGITVAFRTRPGQSLEPRRIASVEHWISSGRARTFAYAEGANPGDDNARAIRALIRSVTAPTVYLGMFPARVLKQNGDGTLELRSEDSRMPDWTQVPIRYGVPGVTARVAPGARVGVEFEGGDPARPVATIWDAADVLELQLAGGDREVARKGDSIEIGTLVVPSGASLIPPGGIVPPLPPGGASIALKGTITSGADKVKA